MGGWLEQHYSMILHFYEDANIRHVNVSADLRQERCYQLFNQIAKSQLHAVSTCMMNKIEQAEFKKEQPCKCLRTPSLVYLDAKRCMDMIFEGCLKYFVHLKPVKIF